MVSNFVNISWEKEERDKKRKIEEITKKDWTKLTEASNEKGRSKKQNIKKKKKEETMNKTLKKSFLKKRKIHFFFLR